MADDLRLTDTQQSIIEALCRPCTGETHFAPPATNQEIADELFLSVDAIKAHLRVLYRKFGIEPLPHNQKRARLVELAVERGVLKGGGAGGDTVAVTGPVDDGSDDAVEAAGQAVIAVPAASPVAVEAPAQEPRRVLRLRRPAPLVAGGAAIGALIVVVLAFLLLGRDGNGGDPAPTPSPAAYAAILERACMQAVTQGETYRQPTRVKRAVAYSQTFDFVKGSIQSSATPAGDNLGLLQFKSGVRDAADLNRRLTSTPPDAPSTQLATISANLTIAAGKIQAGAIKYKLGRHCGELGALAGASAENAAGPP